MNEWGIPDWRDPVAYGDARAWSDMRWRWEFRRRLDEFRAECDLLLDLETKARRALDAIRETQKQEYRHAYSTLVAELEDTRLKHRLQWGYLAAFHPLDPRVSDYPDEVLKVWPNKGVSYIHGSAETAKIKNTVTPEEGQIAIIFSLDQPLKLNLEIAERVLRENQKEQLGRVVHMPNDPKGGEKKARLWLTYLRVMDGKAAIARREFGSPRNWDDIGELIYAGDLRAGDKARKAYAKACDMAKNFP